MFARLNLLAILFVVAIGCVSEFPDNVAVDTSSVQEQEVGSSSEGEALEKVFNAKILVENKTINCGISACPRDTFAVGSKNSNVYHLCHCMYASKIKVENLVCFKSREEAESQNYRLTKRC